MSAQYLHQGSISRQPVGPCRPTPLPCYHL